MKITETLYLENSGMFFKVIEKGVAVNKKTKEESIVDKNPREFGTVYQALQYIVSSDYDVNKDLLCQFQELMDKIDYAEEDIKNRFRVEVKTA